MSVEQVGPGGVSNSYGVRVTNVKQEYDNEKAYKEVFIPEGTQPLVVTTSPDGGVGWQTGGIDFGAANVAFDKRKSGFTAFSGRSTYGITYAGGTFPVKERTQYGLRFVTPVATAGTEYYDIGLPDIVGASGMPASILLNNLYSPAWGDVFRIVYYIGTTAYAKFFTREWNAGATGNKFCPQLRNGGGIRTLFSSYSDLSPSGSPVESDIPVVHKIRIYPRQGKSVDISLPYDDAVVLGAKDVPTIHVISDDGYKSWFDNALPVLSARGIKAGIAVIPDRVGYNANFMTWDEMRAWVAAGNYCHTHGCRNDVANLSVYGNVADAVADAVWSRQRIIEEGCAVDGAENVYVFPQGRYWIDDTFATDLTDALYDAGFTVGRANWSPVRFQTAAYTSKESRMVLPVLGHSWISSATEAANIEAIRVGIANCATQSHSAGIMYHKITTGAAAANIECALTDFTIHMNEIAYWQAAGRLRSVGIHKQVY